MTNRFEKYSNLSLTSLTYLIWIFYRSFICLFHIDDFIDLGLISSSLCNIGLPRISFCFNCYFWYFIILLYLCLSVVCYLIYQYYQIMHYCRSENIVRIFHIIVIFLFFVSRYSEFKLHLLFFFFLYTTTLTC